MLDVYTSPAKCNQYNTLFLAEILVKYSINNIESRMIHHENIIHLLKHNVIKNTIQIDASPLPVNVVYGSFPPFVRVSNMNIQVLTTNASVSPK